MTVTCNNIGPLMLCDCVQPLSSPVSENNQKAGSIVIDDVTDLLNATLAGANMSAAAPNVDLLSSPSVLLETVDALVSDFELIMFTNINFS